jgi:methyl-accepting chemotaxis protein
MHWRAEKEMNFSKITKLSKRSKHKEVSKSKPKRPFKLSKEAKSDKSNGGFFKKGIQQKIAVSFIAITLASLIFIGLAASTRAQMGSKQQFINSTKEILNQNMNYVDFIVNTINNYSMQIFSDTNIQEKLAESYEGDYDKYRASEDVRVKLSTIFMNSSVLESIYIINPDGISAGVPSFNMSAFEDKNIKEEAFYKEAEEKAGKNFWVPTHQNEFSTGSSLIMSNVRLLRSVSTSEPLGVLMININPDIFQKALSSVQIGKEGYMFIVDGEGNVVCQPNAETSSLNIKDRPEVKNALESENKEITFFDETTKTKMFSISAESEKTGWRYIAVVPYKEMLSLSDKIKSIILVISLICLLLVVIASLLVSRSITNPVIKISNAMASVENGDLTVEVDHKSKDEFGELTKTFNKMVKNLRQLVSSVKGLIEDTYDASTLVKESSDQLAISTTDVTSVIEEIAAGAGDQAQQATNSVGTAKSFGEEILSVVGYSKDALDASNDAVGRVDDGKKSVLSLKQKSEQNAVVIKEVSDSIEALSDNTKEIETILSSITSISQQTNLLSLNAAIEAARAGDAGKGFAVVAKEVKKLAGESKDAAGNINAIIKSVNSRTDESVKLARQIVMTLNGQIDYVNSTISAFDQIEGSMGTVGEKINELNNSIENIDKGKDKIETTIDGIAAISEETAASTEEVSASVEEQSAYVEELNAMAEKLNSTSQVLKSLADKFNI